MSAHAKNSVRSTCSSNDSYYVNYTKSQGMSLSAAYSFYLLLLMILCWFVSLCVCFVVVFVFWCCFVMFLGGPGSASLAEWGAVPSGE